MVVTDAFTGTTGTALTTYNASWSLNAGDFDIQSNALAANGAATTTECAAAWTANAFTDDQYAQARLAATSATVNARVGVGVRLALDHSANYYGVYYDQDTGETYVFKNVAGTITQLGALFSGIRSVTDLFRLEGVGGVLEYLLNSVSQGTRSDSAFGSGSTGVVGRGTEPLHRIDDWEGGDIGVVQPTVVRTRKLATQQRMVP